MRSRYRVNDVERAHFVTSPIVDWLPVFTTAGCCDILVGSFEYCRQHKQLRLYGWVVMENHFHAILSAPDLPAVMNDLKKFTARSLVEQLEREGRRWLLDRLQNLRQPHKTHSRYHACQEGFHPQAILDDAMMIQKLEYIHHNPLRRGWVASPEHWRYSSTHERLTGSAPAIVCVPWE
jgi:putative transposase